VQYAVITRFGIRAMGGRPHASLLAPCQLSGPSVGILYTFAHQKNNIQCKQLVKELEWFLLLEPVLFVVNAIVRNQ
jgi:hypothetical protein